MRTAVTSHIPRLQNINYYSQNFDTCVEQFKQDISKLYTNGYSYWYILKNKEVRNAHSKLSSRFLSKRKTKEGDYKTKFPFLKRFVDYVYTRDEIYNPFGNWYRFEYLLPLMVLEFAHSLPSSTVRKRISYPTLAATIFVLFQHRNITSPEEIRKERDDFRRKIKNQYLSDEGQKAFEMLRDGGRYTSKTIKIRRPNYFYKLIGLSGKRTFVENCKLLKIKAAFPKLKNVFYTSAIYIDGKSLDRLKNRFDDFVKSNESKYQILMESLVSIQGSGFVVPPKAQNQVTNYYERELIRDKNIPSQQYLINNPLTRITNYNNKVYCHIQSEFFNFNLLLQSLYLKTNNQRNTIRTAIANVVDQKTKDVLIKSAYRFSKDDLIKKLDSITDNNPKSLSTPLDTKNNRHFKQINECRDIVNEISRNGIFVDLVKINQLLNSVAGSDPNSDDQDSDSDYYDIDQNEDALFPISEKEFSPKQKADELRRIQKSIVQPNPRTKVGKIYGIFTPHGAATHRMTSHNFNLQGINKEIRKLIMAAPRGYSLLSADVSGQDITVAANMALNLYSNPQMFKNDVKEEFVLLKEKIESTLETLCKTTNPINFVKDNILSFNSEILSGWKDIEIRDYIKKAVYTFFYGGTKDSFLNSIAPKKYLEEDLSELLDACENFENSIRVEFEITDVPKLINPNVPQKKYLSVVQIVELFLMQFDETYLAKIKDKYYLSDSIDNLQEIARELNNIKHRLGLRDGASFIFDNMINIIETSYPGILESFQYYNLYYSEKYLTYPTFLGWQTVVQLTYRKDKFITRSKSYPVQASGAEFIRQWLIEIMKSLPNELKESKEFRIVNVIHDQVIVEVKSQFKQLAAIHLLESSKRAAEAIGIQKDTLHIPAVEIRPFY